MSLKKIIQPLIVCLVLLSLGSMTWPIKAQTSFNLILTWSSSSFIPANYPAKALPTQGSRIDVVALTDQPNTSALKFNWRLDNAWQNFASGLGRDTFSFVATQWPGYSHRIYLELAYPGLDGEQVLAEASLDIPIVEPEVYLYQTSQDKTWPDLIGAIDNRVNLLAGTKTYFYGLPYFFNIQKPQDLIYRWYLDNEKANLTDTSRPQVFDLEITPKTQSGTQSQIMLKCNLEKNLSERKTLLIDIIVD